MLVSYVLSILVVWISIISKGRAIFLIQFPPGFHFPLFAVRGDVCEQSLFQVLPKNFVPCFVRTLEQ